MHRKSNFGSHFGLPKPPKSVRKATVNETSFATPWKPRANRRNATGVGVCKASKGLRIWLGLLYLSIDLPLVALIIKARSSTWNASHMSLQMRCGTQEQNLSKIHPKPSQNAPKILPKPSLNPPRTLPEPPFKTEREKKSIFSDFVQFLEGLGPPQIDPKSWKIQKKLKKSKLKKHMFFNSTFFEFSPFWPPKTNAKSRFFCYFFENVDFMKIVLPWRRNCYFSRFEPPKND